MKHFVRLEIVLSILLLAGTAFFTLDLGAQTPTRTPTKTTKEGAAGSKTKTRVAPTGKATAKTKAAVRTVKTPTLTAPEKAKATTTKAKKKPSKGFFMKFLPILLLLIVVTIIIGRLPPPDFSGVDTGWRSQGFRIRRVVNWLPLGLTYSFLYMGRYNLKVSKFAFENMNSLDGTTSLMTNQDFGIIFAAGTIVYGISFLINGPLTDKYGGKFAILVGAGGSCIMNLLMGLVAWVVVTKGPMHIYFMEHLTLTFSVLYAINMYFQSFGAVAIVKVNAAWFHVRERGVFGAIFGILISLGIYFAFDLGYMIKDSMGLVWVFFIPTILLGVFWLLDVFFVRNTPGEAGHEDFDTADASSGDDGPQLGAIEVFKRMMKNPVIVTIALIEFCSGFLRQAIMQWYRTFAKQTDSVLHLKGDFVYENWGMLLCIAGITGGVIAGVISDRMFQSRRGPVAGLLYGVMLLGGVVLFFIYKSSSMVGWLVIIMSMAVRGVHGMLSGTASMDFGGKKNVGIAVGIIDGFVYLGTAVMSITYAFILPKEQLVGKKLVGPATDPANWWGWPIAMIPIALIGFLLALRVWNAKPQPKKKPATT